MSTPALQLVPARTATDLWADLQHAATRADVPADVQALIVGALAYRAVMLAELDRAGDLAVRAVQAARRR